MCVPSFTLISVIVIRCASVTPVRLTVICVVPLPLKLLTIPDPGADTVTVHIVYLVGSRHEGYGEKGMAHLLEHMLFKGSKNFPDVKAELTKRGARWNGTTSNDRTNYFETISATPQNLDWALAMEADRMVNSRVSREDLDSEMTVVRNEFEMGENNPGSVLFQRMQKLAYAWHNYGDPTIGERADIERVPIDKLQAFYRTWYQPDNAILLIAGRFDEQQALELVAKHFGPIPKPTRTLPTYYTDEPTQDGERTVVLRRAGDNPLIALLYRTVAGTHPQYPAIDVLVQVLGDVPSGRLHKALVQKGLTSNAWGAERQLHDPGYMYFGAELAKGADIAKARNVMIDVLENLAKHKITAAEVERGRTRLLNDIERAQLDSGQLVSALSENAAIGDWRLLFLYRDELKKVTVADVQKAGEEYLKRANRVSGTFVPTAGADRAVIPPAPDVEKLLENYKGGDNVRLSFMPVGKRDRDVADFRICHGGLNDVGIRHDITLTIVYESRAGVLTAERLREGREPSAGLSFVAEHAGDIVGTVRLWDVCAGPGRTARSGGAGPPLRRDGTALQGDPARAAGTSALRQAP